MNKVLLLAGVSAAAFYAHKKGYLGEYLDPIKASASEFWAGLSGDENGEQFADESTGDDNVVIDGTGAVSPVVIATSGGVTDAAEANPFVRMLRENEYDLNPWSTQNLYWVAAICNQENRGRNPEARGSAGEIGVMQVKPSTAADLVRWGYTKYPATEEILSTVNGGLYFGTAYLEYLSKKNADRAWITKAYNGGPGFASLSADYVRAREAYLEGVERKYLAIRGVERRVSRDINGGGLNTSPVIIPHGLPEGTWVNPDGTFGVMSDPYAPPPPDLTAPPPPLIYTPPPE
ncbi:MAG: transglycosylase SLT domain-containing protein [Rhodobacteraceae bacterium]|nr:transglycosylase SLT domain-containing protein [Paracoccaceae bacterium]